jgi:hypothetical protein
MEDIDITDKAFSLMTTPVSVTPIDSDIEFNNSYIWVGAAILVFFVGIAYKYYLNRKTNNAHQEEMDCEGGFCNMNMGPIKEL